MNTSERIQENYVVDDLPGRFDRALKSAGFGPIAWSELAPIDQFHVRGLAATQELSEALGLTGGETVLDVGCGFGGPARYLAATRNCRVTGIDLTPSYIEVAEMLSVRTGLSDQLTFLEGDALKLPFAPENFDHAWTQHVAMNIADKEALYTEIYRVLKPGGRLAIYDVVRGNGEPLIYPVPWARQSDISFVATENAMRQDLKTARFREISIEDTTAQGLAWFKDLQASTPKDQNVAPFNLAAILGPDVRQLTANFAQNLAEGRARLIQVIVQRD